MITLSELQLKEVVIMEDGKRLGFISDLEMDEAKGIITAIVIADRQMKGNIFNKASELIIPWDRIVTIGTDIVLIKSDSIPHAEIKNETKTEANNEES